MTKQATERCYQVKVRMSVDEAYYVRGYARTEEHLKELVEHLKKTWRYVDVYPYEARVITPEAQKSRRKKRD